MSSLNLEGGLLNSRRILTDGTELCCLKNATGKLASTYFRAGRSQGLFVLASKQNIKLDVGNTQEEIAEQQVFYLEGSVSCSVQLPPGAVCWLLLMDRDRLREIVGSGPLGVRSVSPAMQSCLHQLLTHKLQAASGELFNKAQLLEFFSHYLNPQLPQAYKLKESEVAKLLKVKQIIRENVHQPPSTKNLALMIGTNEFTLKRYFKAYFGLSIHTFVTQYRLELGRQFIDLDQLQVKEAAYRAGFSSASHFIAAYKKKYGVTPKQHDQVFIS